MSITFDTYNASITLLEPMLGTTPLSRKVFEEHVVEADEISDEMLEEEIETIPAEEDERPGWTGFHRDEEGNVFIYDYMIKGFFKGACKGLRRSKATTSSKLTAYIKCIDGLVFVEPRRIMLELPEGQGVTEATDEDDNLAIPNKRPLRAQTPKGERVSIARSETVPAGTKLSFAVKVLSGTAVTEELIREWLEYGQLVGLGQWRNAGWGRFTCEVEIA